MIIITTYTTHDQQSNTLHYAVLKDTNEKKEVIQFTRNLVMKMQHVNSANLLRSVARKVKETPLQETPDVEKHSVEIVEAIPTPHKNKDILVVIGTSTGGPRALHQ